MPRRKRLKLSAVARRALLFVAGSLFAGFLAIFLHAVLVQFRRDLFPAAGSFLDHVAVSIAVGVAVAATLWLLGLLKHPPLMLRNVPPLAAGLCAGLGVHIARLWIK